MSGWVYTAAAGAAFAGGLYSLLKRPEPDQVAVEAGGGGVHTEEPAQAVVWTKPKVGWLKLNVDGSLVRESAGCGGVLRNASGEWVCGFAQKLSPSSKVDQIEKEGILRGLQWAQRRGWKKVMVESDNEGVVALVNNISKRIPTNDLICEIRGLLDSPDWDATLTWIPREANQVADKVADYARAWHSFDFRELNKPPQNCIPALFKDQQLLAEYGAAF